MIGFVGAMLGAILFWAVVVAAGLFVVGNIAYFLFWLLVLRD